MVCFVSSESVQSCKKVRTNLLCLCPKCWPSEATAAQERILPQTLWKNCSQKMSRYTQTLTVFLANQNWMKRRLSMCDSRHLTCFQCQLVKPCKRAGAGASKQWTVAIDNSIELLRSWPYSSERRTLQQQTSYITLLITLFGPNACCFRLLSDFSNMHPVLVGCDQLLLCIHAFLSWMLKMFNA